MVVKSCQHHKSYTKAHRQSWGQSKKVIKNHPSIGINLYLQSLPFIFLSGVVWPFGVIPTAVNLFAKLISSTSVMHGLVRLNQMNASFYMTLSNCLILWILCLFYYFFALQITNNKIIMSLHRLMPMASF